MKIRLLGAELFHADERIEVTKLKVTYRDFANAPKNGDQQHLNLSLPN
jgi:hypothetical protein